MGYPGALGIDLSQEKGDWPAILKKVEAAVEKAGGKERMGTWAYSYGYTNSAALAEYGKRIVEGKAKLGDLKDLIACYNEFTPGAKWNASIAKWEYTYIKDVIFKKYNGRVSFMKPT